MSEYNKYAGVLSNFYKGFNSFLRSMPNNKIVRGIASSVGVGVGLGLINEFLNLVMGYLEDKYNIKKSREYFTKMLEAHPQLKEFEAEEVAKYYASLYHFSPTMAKDPLASGAFLTQSLKKLSGEELGGPPPDTFSTLADIEKKVNESKKAIRKDRLSDQIYSGVSEQATKELINMKNKSSDYWIN